MIKIILGSIFSISGFTGLTLEISRFYRGGQWDNGGVILALLLIVSGGFLFYSGWKKKNRKTGKSPEAPESGESGHLKRESESLSIKIISIMGIIFSLVTALLGILLIFSGGILLKSLITGEESGWGILGIGTSIIGLGLLLTAVIRLVGYIMLLRMNKVGWIMVIILEAICLIYRFYLTLQGFAILFALPLLWSFVVLIVLGVKRKLFFSEERNPS